MLSYYFNTTLRIRVRLSRESRLPDAFAVRLKPRLGSLVQWSMMIDDLMDDE